MKKFPTLQQRAIAATEGNNTRTGTILLACVDEKHREEAYKAFPLPRCPAFHGKATVTSDGFLMCDFTGRDGERHMGAFVGSLTDFRRSVRGLCDHMKLKADEREELEGLFRNWIGTNYQSDEQVTF